MHKPSPNARWKISFLEEHVIPVSGPPSPVAVGSRVAKDPVKELGNGGFIVPF